MRATSTPQPTESAEFGKPLVFVQNVANDQEINLVMREASLITT
jgi:hypothetical protein